LGLATRAFQGGERNLDRLRLGILETLEAEPLAKVDYAELVDPDTFTPPGTLAVLAVWIGKTRLIDNHDLPQTFPG
jgi:pantoate--beta-alanine ligase